jgi:mitosis inhibitor protein kinase SWE1
MAVTRLDFTGIDTPSPPAPVRTYPFANGNAQMQSVPSPSPPRRKGTLLQRLQGSKHKTLRRISNPLLSAAYKLGEQQAQFGNHMKNFSNDSSKGPKQGRASVGGSLPGTTRFEKDFVMLEPIGNGEFSTVWKVKEKKTGKVWAVKRGKPYLGLKDR